MSLVDDRSLTIVGIDETFSPIINEIFFVNVDCGGSFLSIEYISGFLFFFIFDGSSRFDTD